MIRFTFIKPDGAEVAVEAEAGTSVMQAALDNGVDGITAECNGSAACATCHAFFDPEIVGQLAEMSEHEDDMLDFAAVERRPESRLSCQVPVCDVLAERKVRLPAAQ